MWRSVGAAILFCSLVGVPALAEPGGGTALSSPDDLLLEVRIEKSKAYLHEPLPLTVTLLSGPVTLRNIEFPRLGGTGFALGEFSPSRQRSVVRDGRDLTAYEFTTTLTPRRSGTLRPGPAELRCEVATPADGPAAFFGATEPRRVTLRSELVPLEVLPLPDEGRPAGFSGAVGRFTLATAAQPARVSVGDPLTVVTTVRGAGNLDSIPCPQISGPGLRAYPPRARRQPDVLVCEQVVIPESATAREIPALGLPFFDPAQGKYRIAAGKPIHLDLLDASPQPAPSSAGRPAARQTIREHPARKRLAAVATIISGCLALALLSLVLARQGRYRRCHPDMNTGEQTHCHDSAIAGHLVAAEQALSRNEYVRFCTELYRLLQYWGDSGQRAKPAAMTAYETLDSLRARGFDTDTLATLGDILAVCDRVRYAPDRPDGTEMSEMLTRVRKLLHTTPPPFL